MSRLREVDISREVEAGRGRKVGRSREGGGQVEDDVAKVIIMGQGAARPCTRHASLHNSGSLLLNTCAPERDPVFLKAILRL